jgi:hypothetical protein
MSQSTDIKWVKNIKRDDGTAWAYMEDEYRNEFLLNFSDTQLPNASAVREGEIILLFQRVDHMANVPVATYLTHLVTPLDDMVTKIGNNVDFPFVRSVGVIARAQNVRSTPRILSFHKPNWGKVCPITLLNERLTEGQIQETVWNLFEGHFNQSFEQYQWMAAEGVAYADPELLSGLEGREREILRKHIIRERRRDLVEAVRRMSMERDGELRCEACSFTFLNMYGPHGATFIECHHKIPIATGGERVTTLDDLALVCANCHRMLHRKNTDGEYYTVPELRALIQTRPWAT